MAKSSSPFNAAEAFDDLFKTPQGERAATGLKLIQLQRIQVQNQPRKSFPKEEQLELVASIRELSERGEGIEGTGILQPLVVTPNGDGYRLIAGERRLRAAGEANLAEVPAIVIQSKDENIGLLQIIENLQRQNLRPLEEAQAIQSMMDTQNLSLRAVASLLGKKKGYVENRLNLLKMGTDLQDLVSVRTDTLQHARLIEPIQTKSLRHKLIESAKEGASERDIRKLIEKSQPVENRKIEKSNVKNQLSVRTDTQNKTSSEIQIESDDTITLVIRPAITQLKQGVMTLESSWNSTRKPNAQSLQAEIKEIEILLNKLKKLAK